MASILHDVNLNLFQVAVTKIVFKCNTNRQSLVTNFDELPLPEIPDVYPEIPDFFQTVSFYGITDKMTHFGALKTYDANNELPISNIISYYVYTE